MQHIKFNHTDLAVSPVCLGTVNYGTAMPEAEAKAQISKFLDAGGNFLDTAHIYGDWGEGPKCVSERVVGNWLRENGKRGQLILATKGAHPDWGHMEIPRVNRKCIEKDLKESLEYLNTDYIDLYFLHRDDPGTPVSEIMECLDDARKAGHIRYYGCSNWALPRIKEAQAYCKEHGLQGFSCNQLMWSLADINFFNLADKTFILMDEETRAYHAESGMNVMAYMSVAKGYFARRAAGEALPASVTEVYGNASNDDIYGLMQSIAAEGAYSIMDLTYMYIMAEKLFPSVPIASFDNMSHLADCVGALEKPIPEALIEKLAARKKFVYWK
ncbi:MAG: aldo/keto reductase [Candidatus Pelethousia sp.]|nr:aldo/keto reductase [Candidatus Pelethousia sp.]